MIERREHLRLAREARGTIGIERELRRQYFQRDITRELGVARAIHLAHAAGTEGVEDFESADSRARLKSHLHTFDIREIPRAPGRAFVADEIASTDEVDVEYRRMGGASARATLRRT
jgi:hypothetical protein